MDAFNNLLNLPIGYGLILLLIFCASGILVGLGLWQLIGHLLLEKGDSFRWWD